MAVLETVLRQFRQVAAAGSLLAISVSVSSVQAEVRSRFAESVAALGEPARSVLGADEAADLLARTGWRITAAADPDDPQATARRQRLRAVGLLTARTATQAGAALHRGGYPDGG